jgi:hypothetical protein
MVLLAAAQPIVAKVPEATHGVSLESLLVFGGGLLAAIAAVIAALLTTRGAADRLQKTLTVERDRFDKQLVAERERLSDQIGHERYLAKREEASAAVERITRLVARTSANFDEIKRALTFEGSAAQEHFDHLEGQVEQIREEISVVAIRFGGQSALVSSMIQVLTVLLEGWQQIDKAKDVEELEWKERLQKASEELGDAVGAFVNEARIALETY